MLKEAICRHCLGTGCGYDSRGSNNYCIYCNGIGVICEDEPTRIPTGCELSETEIKAQQAWIEAFVIDAIAKHEIETKKIRDNPEFYYSKYKRRSLEQRNVQH